MGHAVERIFLPVMKMQYPEIVDVAMPAEGIFHNLMIVAIRKSYPGHARKIMSAIWSLGRAMFLGGGRRRSRCERPGLPRSHLEGTVRRRSRARCAVCVGAGGFARSRLAPARLRVEDGHRRNA